MALVGGKILPKRGHGTKMAMFLGVMQDGRQIEIQAKQIVEETTAIGTNVTKAKTTIDA